MKTGCIIQARMTSSRLPGKVLKTIDFENDTTILEEVINRVRLCPGVDQVIIATTVNKEDDAIAELSCREDVTCFRGSELDVLDRYYHAACENSLDRVLRITSDCPFTDPLVLGGVIDLFETGGFDYVSNAIERSFPHGLDCEMFSFEALESAFRNTEFCERDMFYREHVTTFIYGNPGMFRLGNYSMPDGLDYRQLRITVDTKEDYLLACVLRSYLSEGYTYNDIIHLFEMKPYLSEINAASVQKRNYSTLEEEVGAAIALLKLQEMGRAAEMLSNNLAERKAI